MTSSCSPSPTRSPAWASRSATTACSRIAASRPAGGARAAGRARLDGRRGTRDRLGRHASQAPPLLRPTGRPAQPARRPAPGWRGSLRGLGHAHIGWIFRGKDKANPARYAKDLLADRDLRFISRTFPLWVARRAGAPVRARRRADRHASRADWADCSGVAPRACCCCITRPSASTRCVTPSAADPSRPAITRATSPGWRRSRSAKPGTTTITPSRVGPAWPGSLAAGSQRRADQRPGALPPGLGRHPDQPRPPTGQTGGGIA